MRRLKWYMLFLGIIILMFWSTNSFAKVNIKPKALKIVAITNINFTIYKGNKFLLPSKVKAIMNTKKVSLQPVSWNAKLINTNIIGTFNYYGVVKGYTKKINLRITIKKLPIKIKSLVDTIFNLNQNQAYTLPKTLRANMSDGTTENVAVLWDAKTVDSSKVTTNVYNGRVVGYNKLVKFTISIVATISTITDLDVNIKQNETYSLPETVVAQMSDGTIQNMPVTWDINFVDSSKVGTSIYNGLVHGYDKPIKLNLIVTPIISNINDINVNLNYNDKYEFPGTVLANMSDGTTQNINVIWDRNVVDSDTPQTNIYNGKAEGYDKSIKLMIIVLPPIINSISTVNGMASVKLSAMPVPLPTLADFALTQDIDNIGAVAIQIKSLELDPLDTTNTTYKLNYDLISASKTDQSVVITASYKGEKGVAAMPIVVAQYKGYNPNITSQQDFYDAIKYALGNFQDSIELNIKNFNETVYPIDIATKVIYENPDLDYGYSGSTATYSSKDKDGYTNYKMSFSYKLSKDAMIEEKAAVEKKVDSIISTVITPGMTDYQKELALHNYVISNADYDKRYPNEPIESHNPYGVLVLGTGVCDSYAKAIYILMNKVSIETKYVIGTANNGSGSIAHAWNIIKLGGEWYQLDATWDDPIVSGGSSVVMHDYFNVSDDMIFKNHIEDKSISDYPVCTSSIYNFFNMGGPEYDSLGNPMSFINNTSEFYNAVKAVIEAKGTKLSLVLLNSNKENYNLSDTVHNIVNGNYALGYSVSYSQNGVDSNIQYYEMSFNY